MSAEWDSQLPVNQLLLPQNGQQVPGSGTTVIGGPLPAELIAVTSSTVTGIIWWSNNGLYKYWFMIKTEGAGGDTLGNVWIGYVSLDGTVNTVKKETSYQVQVFVPQSPGHVGGVFNSGNNLLRGLQFSILPGGENAGSVIQLMGESAAGVQAFAYWNIFQSGVSVMTCDDPNIDQWLTNTITKTVNGAANTTMRYDWKVTMDRICEVRLFITFVNVPVAGIINELAPVALPSVVNPPGVTVNAYGPYAGPVMANPGTLRYNTSAKQIVTTPIPAIAQGYTASWMFTVDKPTA